MLRQKHGIREGSRLASMLIYLATGLCCIVTVYPMYYVLILSLSEPSAAATMKVYTVPKGFSLAAYETLVTDSEMWRAYFNTFLYVVPTTLLMLFTCVLAAYPLTYKNLRGRKYINMFLLIPMYFSGGMIPTYIVVQKLNLLNTPLSLILPTAVVAYYLIIARTFFQNTIPEELLEVSFIDGADYFTYFFKIVLPLSKPILAVMILFHVVNH